MVPLHSNRTVTNTERNQMELMLYYAMRYIFLKENFTSQDVTWSKNKQTNKQTKNHCIVRHFNILTCTLFYLYAEYSLLT